MSSLYLSILVVLGFSIVSCEDGGTGQKDKPEEVSTKGETPKVNADFLKNVPGWLDEYKVPAAGIGLIENGEIKHIQVFGELEAQRKAPENTVFNVASVTKTIGTILVLTLVEQGQWDLDESLSNYWVDPDVADDPLHKELTTRHVLSHTTGFVNWRENHPSKKLTFDNPPGEKFGYSGEGFQYLQNAIENKFRQPVETLTDSLIFKPLDMQDTQHAWDTTTDEERFAYWHDSHGSKYDISNKTYWACLDDDLLTTVQDYCKFGVEVINGAGLSTELFADMVQPHSNRQANSAIGLGWFLVTGIPDGEYVIHHGGGDTGVRTAGVFLPESKRGVVVFTNGDNGIPIIVNVIKEAFIFGDDLWTNMYAMEQPSSISLPVTTMEKYVGGYENPDGAVLSFHIEDENLFLSGTRWPRTQLYAKSESVFFNTAFDQEFHFAIDSTDGVDRLIVFLDGDLWYHAEKVY